MNCSALSPAAPAWLEYLAPVRHDFYHLPAYVHLSASGEQGVGCAFVAEKAGNRFVLPLIVRPLSSCRKGGSELLDAVSPHGYPCPLVYHVDGHEPDDRFVEEALQALQSFWKKRGIISVFARLHPLLPCRNLPAFKNHGSLVQHGETVVIDLALPQAELWRQTSATTRNLINVGKRNNYVADMATSPENIAEFSQLYTETMLRVNSAPTYLFSERYFSKLFLEMGEHFHLCLVRVDGRVAGGAIFSECCGIVQYHLSGSKAAYAKYPITRFMLDFIRTWAKERGNKQFHLGGGYGAMQDSLFKFKAGFSPLRRPFHTWRIIVDPVAYDAQVAEWEQVSGASADPITGFFPAYRKGCAAAPADEP